MNHFTSHVSYVRLRLWGSTGVVAHHMGRTTGPTDVCITPSFYFFEIGYLTPVGPIFGPLSEGPKGFSVIHPSP